MASWQVVVTGFLTRWRARMNCARLALVAGVFASACTAQMINRPGSTPSAYGPTRRAVGSEIGVIKYVADGAPDVVQKRKEDAYKQMYGACAGSYEIVSEGPSHEGGTATAIELPGTLIPMTTAVAAPTNIWTIQFRCIDDVAASGGAARYDYPAGGQGAKVADGRPCPVATVVVSVETDDPLVEAETCAIADRGAPILHGPYVAWWKDSGRAESVGWYLDGVKDGEWVAHDRNGIAVSATTWSRGRVVKRTPFTPR